MPYKEFEPKDSLEAVMSKLWGDPREVNPKTRLEEIILKIANAQPTGPSVPEITAQDEGKVLTVEAGEATWATGGGGGGVFLITDTSGTLNKTYTEIYTAFIAGLVCIIHREESDEEYLSVGDYIVIGLNTSTEDEYTDYIVTTTSGGTVSDRYRYIASSASDYPSL